MENENLIKTLEERWDHHAGSYDANHHGHLSREDLDRWLFFLETHLGRDKGQKILDVGCGTGFLTLKMTALGYRCQGLDLSSGMLAIAREKAEEQGFSIEFLKGNVTDLPMPDASIDTITNRSLLWTLLDPKAALGEWFRVLKPAGCLLCFCSVGGSGPDNHHNHHYDREIEDRLELKAAKVSKYCACLEDAGFTRVEAVILGGITGKHGNNPWYVIKGEKPI